MNEHDVQICALLRHFESDIDYLHFGDFWIEKLTEEEREKLCKDLSYFNNYPGDQHIAVEYHYIGRGEFSDFLRRRIWIFWFPLFRLMRLFKQGDLIIPICFAYVLDKWREMRFHGEDSYGSGCFSEGNPYVFKKEDIEPFNTFRKEIKTYLEHLNFIDNPYHKKPKILKEIDTRCFLAIHLILKGSIENWNPFSRIDKLIDYTIGLESLYLLRDEDKRKHLSLRIAALLGKDEREQEEISRNIKKCYDIRSDIVHGSGIDQKGEDFLHANIYKYEDYLRKSILAFLDFNLRNPTKKAVLRILDKAILDSDLRKEIRDSLNILKLAK